MTVELRVTNLATLRDAKVYLNRLLVLMGPNNSGKSTIAVLLYAACRAVFGEQRPRRAVSQGYIFIGSASFAEFDRRHMPRASRDLLDSVRRSKTPEDLARVFPQSVRSLMTRPMKQALDAYARTLAQELERCFGATLAELIRQPSNGQPMRIEIAHGDEWTISITVAKGRRPAYDCSLTEMDDDVWSSILRTFLRNRPIWNELRSALRRDESDVEYLLHSLFDHVRRYYFRSFPPNAHYLPASRSGALQSHRVLAAAMVRQSTYAGIEDVAIPKLPGVVADFIGELLELDQNRRTQFEEIAALLEREVLHGEIELSSAKSTAPEINFASAGTRHALHRTSSMVSELAPIVLFLRHVVNPRDLLIIEEPESHLHPASQVNFVTTLARLISANVHVTVTTHSDYIINQVSNLIMAAAVQSSPTSERANSARSFDVTIPCDVVAAYLFSPKETEGGSVVQPLAVDAEGISDAEFAEVAEWLYNTSASLAQEVNTTDA